MPQNVSIIVFDDFANLNHHENQPMYNSFIITYNRLPEL